MKKIISPPYAMLRAKQRTKNLLETLNKGSADKSIMWLWKEYVALKRKKKEAEKMIKIYETKNGAKIRVIQKPPFTVKFEGEDVEVDKKIVFLKFTFRSSIYQCVAIATSVRKYPGYNWTLESLEALANCMMKEESWKLIDEELAKILLNYEVGKFEKKNADGVMFQEYDCSGKRKFENLKNNGFKEDIWNPDISDWQADEIASKAFKGFPAEVAKIPKLPEAPKPTAEEIKKMEKEKAESLSALRKRLGIK